MDRVRVMLPNMITVVGEYINDIKEAISNHDPKLYCYYYMVYVTREDGLHALDGRIVTKTPMFQNYYERPLSVQIGEVYVEGSDILVVRDSIIGIYDAEVDNILASARTSISIIDNHTYTILSTLSSGIELRDEHVFRDLSESKYDLAFHICVAKIRTQLKHMVDFDRTYECVRGLANDKLSEEHKPLSYKDALIEVSKHLLGDTFRIVYRGSLSTEEINSMLVNEIKRRFSKHECNVR